MQNMSIVPLVAELISESGRINTDTSNLPEPAVEAALKYSLQCFCELPASWFLVDAPVPPAVCPAGDFLSANDLFDQLCDGCFRRVVTESESNNWVRISLDI